MKGKERSKVHMGSLKNIQVDKCLEAVDSPFSVEDVEEEVVAALFDESWEGEVPLVTARVDSECMKFQA